MTRKTPLYGLPALDGTDKPKEYPQQSWDFALLMEAILSNQGQTPLASELVDLVKRLNKLEAGGNGAKFLALGKTAKTVNSVTVMDNYDAPKQNTGFRSWSGSLLTIDKAGDYMVVHSAGSATGLNGGQSFITINGDAAANRFAFQDGPSNMTSLYVAPFAAGDTIRPWCYTNASGTVDANRTSFAVRAV